MKKLFIWDFDGTLVDTITDVGICFNQALAENGFPTHNLSLYRNFVGGNLETVISRLLPQEKVSPEHIEAVKAVYRPLYLESKKPNTLPFPGIPKVLSVLSSAGVKHAISTNKSQVLTEDLCQRFFSEMPFLGIMGYDPKRPHKPDPSGVEEILRLAAVKKADAIYVGDGYTDVLTAENAGIDCLFVTWGQGKPGDEKHDCVTYIAHRSKDILTYFERTGL